MMNLTARPLFGREDDIGYFAALINGLEGNIEIISPLRKKSQQQLKAEFADDLTGWVLKLIVTTANLEPYIGKINGKPTVAQSVFIADIIQNFKTLYPYYFEQQPLWAKLLNYGAFDDD